MNAREAEIISHTHRIPLNEDFHALDSSTVERILAVAKTRKYRKPAKANGSTARCFHAYLVRAFHGRSKACTLTRR